MRGIKVLRKEKFVNHSDQIRNAGNPPRLFALEKLAVCSNLELQTHLAVHDDLQFTQDGLELGAQALGFPSHRSVLGLQLSLAVLLGASQSVDFTSQLLVLRYQPSTSSSLDTAAVSCQKTTDTVDRNTHIHTRSVNI